MFHSHSVTRVQVVSSQVSPLFQSPTTIKATQILLIALAVFTTFPFVNPLNALTTLNDYGIELTSRTGASFNESAALGIITLDLAGQLPDYSFVGRQKHLLDH